MFVTTVTVLVEASSSRAAEPVSVWYRSAEGCPSADTFLARLAAQDVTATIARVGDQIDFVVTLGRDERSSSGTLERQSTRGTVAIREVRASTCDAVADALVLTLALTVGSDGGAGSPSASPVEEDVMPEAKQPEPMPAGTQPKPLPAASASAPSSERHVARRENQESAIRPGVGLHASVGQLVGSSALFGANAFVDVRYERGMRPSGRLGLVGNFANDAAPDVGIQLILGRIEGCPTTLGRRLAFQGCVALDLGAMRAQNEAPEGKSGADFWSAAWGIARVEYALSDAWALELQAGISVPLTHYELTAGDPPQTLLETQRVTFGLAAGARFGWP